MNTLSTVLIFILTLYFNLIGLKAQNVSIPDANFKIYLVGNTAINTNGDGEIQVSEATAFAGAIYCPYRNIVDLTGIEAFVNLTSLSCEHNQLLSLDLNQNTSLTTLNCAYNYLSKLDFSQNTNLAILNCSDNMNLANLNVTQNINLIRADCSFNLLNSLNVTQNTNLEILQCQANQLDSLDVTQNTSLITLYCTSNQLSNLDVTQNTNLMNLDCSSNQLSSLDLTQNASLAALYCNLNQLSSLDVTQNTSLIALYCTRNQITSLNVKNGNNSNFMGFNARNNPNLTCIEVDDSTYSTSNWTNVDPTAVFRTNCSLFSNINTINKEIKLTAYPNPTAKEIILDLGKTYEVANIQVSNLTGQIILNRSLEDASSTSLELRGAVGVYFVHIQTKEGTATLKVIKE